MNVLLSFMVLIIAIQYSVTLKPDTYTEELLIKPLYSEQVYAYFQFTTKWDIDVYKESFHHTHLFPRPLGEMVKRYNVQELHVSLTGGLWRYESWGYPVIDAASGAEVWAWFKPDTEDIDKNWKELASSLSGLLCASLNFVDDTNTISPKFTFQPTGAMNLNLKSNLSLARYANLPREIVCTENLTPWKKLLPCDSRVGLGGLLNSGYIHNTKYHSLALHLRPICRDESCKQISLELQQSISLVYDYRILGTKNWSLRKLFGQGLLGICPLATRSTVYVDVTTNSSAEFKLTPEPDAHVTSVRGGQVSNLAKFEVPKYHMEISATYPENDDIQVLIPPALYATQYVSGYGQENGGLFTKIYNNHWNHLNVVLLQNIPWFVPIYLHTLSIKIDGKETKPLGLKYVPGKLRKRAYHLEVALRLPPRSTTVISVDFDYVFLKWQEYPPDANHGFYIGSAVVSSLLPLAKNYSGIPQDGSTIADSFNASRQGYLVHVRTENIVITLPTPDFSMPYNVICLACTVVALAFGPLHNITTKRLILKTKDNEKFITKMKNRIIGFFKSKKEESSSIEQSVCASAM